MYGQPSGADELAWSWVDQQLEAAGTYWVTPTGPDRPHPRPVWGIWHADSLHLSIGSLVLARQLADDPVVTVHLDSGIDVVIIEGAATGSSDETGLLEHYNAKYDWTYTVAKFGPLTRVDPSKVLAWRSTGFAGRDGFQASGKWRFS